MNQTVNPRTLAAAEQSSVLSEAALERLFRGARTHNAWQDKAVPHALLREAVELAKLAPTAANSNPLRVVFVESEAGKARLKPALDEGNAQEATIRARRAGHSGIPPAGSPSRDGAAAASS